MINYLRYLLGLLIVGPIAGVLGYLSSPKPLMMGLGMTLITGLTLTATAAAATSVWPLALFAGAIGHVGMGIFSTIKNYRKNAKNIADAGVGEPGQGMWDATVMSDARKESYSPIPRGLYFGFTAANITAGDYVYGSKARDLCDTLNGVVRPKRP